MARPKKDPALRMNTDVRIPVTAEQKSLLIEAISDEAAGLAAWARGILLDAARRRIARAKDAAARNGSAKSYAHKTRNLDT